MKPGAKFNPEFVSKLLNVAFGLFLNSDVKLNPLNSYDSTINDDRKMWCDFRESCVWFSHGATGDPWSLATGEPETLTWLAATGTTVLPASPFAFIELRGAPGDRLTSSEILCQEGDGVFEFTYWLTAGAKAQACAVDSTSNSGILCSGELLKHFSMPQRAKFVIPGPIFTPFKIAIYASGTGFMVVDNIEYKATFCQPTEPPTTTTPTTTTTTPQPVTQQGSSTPLGASSIAVPLTDRRTGDAITKSSQLICDFGGAFECQWGPTVTGEEQWGSLDGEADPVTWEQMLDTDVMADMPAAIARYGAGPLTTDTLYCLKGSAQVLLRWWVTEGVTLRVCAFDVIRGDQITCGDSSNDEKHNTAYPGPTVIQFPQAITTPFVFSIIPDWSQSTSGFIIIDDLAFFGEICDTVPSPEDLGLVPPPFVPRSSKSKPVKFTTTTTPAPTTALQVWTATTQQPESFWVRPTPRPRNRLSIRPAASGRQVANIIHTPFLPSTSPPPPRPLPKRIISVHNRFITTTTQPPLLAPRPGPIIAPVVAPRLPPAPAPPPRVQPSSPVDASLNEWKKEHTNVCDILSCDFARGGCGYRTNRAGKAFWALRSTPYGPPISRHTDIRIEPGTGFFVGTRLKAKTANLAILESPSFSISRLKVFQFRYYRATAGTQLRICFETDSFHFVSASQMRDCPLAIPPLDGENARKWSTGRFTLHPGHTKFYLVAEQEMNISGTAVIALDTFRVAPCRL